MTILGLSMTNLGALALFIGVVGWSADVSAARVKLVRVGNDDAPSGA